MWEEVRGVSRYLDCKTSFTDASGPRKREQPDLRSAEQIRYLFQVSLSAYKRGRRYRQGGVEDGCLGQAAPVTPLGHRREEDSAIVLGKLQRIGEGAHCVRVGTIPRAALQVADAPGGQAGLLSQLLLRQPSGFPQLPQPRAKRGVPFSAHVARPSLVMNLRACPQVRSMVTDNASDRRVSPGLTQSECVRSA